MSEPIRTGKTRHRVLKRMFGEPLLVLQIQILEKGGRRYRNDEQYGIDAWDEPDRTYWRDATVEDITEDLIELERK